MGADADDRFRRVEERADALDAIQRAGRILTMVGDSEVRALNAQSASNDVWITDRHVLRLSRERGDTSLNREAELAQLLPTEIGYPSVSRQVPKTATTGSSAIDSLATTFGTRGRLLPRVTAAS